MNFLWAVLTGFSILTVVIVLLGWIGVLFAKLCRIPKAYINYGSVLGYGFGTVLSLGTGLLICYQIGVTVMSYFEDEPENKIIYSDGTIRSSE